MEFPCPQHYNRGMRITYYVHSITEDNEQGLATGWLDGRLSEEGLKRAVDVGLRLEGKELDAVFCSDLQRAMDSADLFFGEKFSRFLDWRLRECNYGSLDGTPAKDFKKNREHEYIKVPYPDGESYQDVEKRMQRFLEDAKDLYSDGHIGIVGHQATQLALEVITKEVTWEEAFRDDWRRTQSWQLGWEYTY